jgi:ABC-type Fe3+ transport system substrate-binding protein
MKHPRALAFLAGLISIVATTAPAQSPDPRLAASWAFMQKEMPGAPLSLLQAACAEGVVMIYYGTWADAQEAQIKGFQEKFPCIKVEKFTSDTGNRRERWLAESRAGRYIADIVQDTDTGFLDRQARDGHLLEYKISNDGAFEEATKKTGYWYPLRVALVGIAWNTDLVSDAEARKLSTWEGITDPVWKGRAAVVDPAAGGVAYLPWYIWSKQHGPEFFKKIGALRPRNIAAIVPASAALAAGDIEVIFNASETGLLPLVDKGAPIRWSLPSPGIGPMTGQAIPARAPHPNAAKLYQEYAFTEDGYGRWQKLGGAPVRKGFKDQRPVAAQPWYKIPATYAPYDTEDASLKTKAVMDEFRQYIGSAR